MLKRGDEIMECFRRYFSDQGTFQNIEDDVDLVLDGHLHAGFLTMLVIKNSEDGGDN
jgi:hypothetical protein